MKYMTRLDDFPAGSPFMENDFPSSTSGQQSFCSDSVVELFSLLLKSGRLISMTEKLSGVVQKMVY